MLRPAGRQAWFAGYVNKLGAGSVYFYYYIPYVPTYLPYLSLPYLTLPYLSFLSSLPL